MILVLRRSSVLAAALLLTSLPSIAQSEHWVGTWATSPVTMKNPDPKAVASDATLREIVHVSIGGPAVRIILTNEFGIEPLTVGAASVAPRTSGGDTAAPVSVTFSGRASVVIPPGAMVVSDAAPLKLAPLSDLAVSLYIPHQEISFSTIHGFSDTTNYGAAGDQTMKATLSEPQKVNAWQFLKGVDVQSDGAAIVCFGDSITDGARSTKDANMRWPDILAARLQADKKLNKLGVLNQGIGGNRVLHDVTGPSALARFDRDVIAMAGVKYLIFLEAINDIGHAYDPKKPYDVVTAEDLITGYSQMARRAHAHGIKVYGATLTPYVGAGYSSPEGEKVRSALNEWIRTSKELDGFIDFDKVIRDPAKPDTFASVGDSGDHLHPKDAGYEMMGDSIDLKLFSK